MAFAKVSWEISTADPTKAVEIGRAVRQALAGFHPCVLLSDTVLFVRDIRRFQLGFVYDPAPGCSSSSACAPRPGPRDC
jgi:hypothetical protein